MMMVEVGRGVVGVGVVVVVVVVVAARWRVKETKGRVVGVVVVIVRRMGRGERMKARLEGRRSGSSGSSRGRSIAGGLTGFNHLPRPPPPAQMESKGENTSWLMIVGNVKFVQNQGLKVV